MSDNTSKAKRKPPLFPVFLFIGMGIGFLLIPVSPLAFISSMFIGMGLGFLLNEVVVIEEKRVKIEIPMRVGGITMVIIGTLFIAGGVFSIVAPDLLQRYATVFLGIGFITAGALIFFYGLGLLRAKTCSSPSN
ncbi:MAG: hypothetical protein QXK88_06415 [Desulfurococcaceae archaeon]